MGEIETIYGELLQKFDPDVVQDVVTRYLARQQQGEPPPEDLRHYLHAACARESRGVYRDERRESRNKQGYATVTDPVDPCSPHDRAVARETLLDMDPDLVREEFNLPTRTSTRTRRRRRAEAKGEHYG